MKSETTQKNLISIMHTETSIVEISASALKANLNLIRKLSGKRIICPAVKANAYGHGIITTSKLLEEAGADWLGVNAIYEAQELRKAGIKLPIYILGYVPLSSIHEAIINDFRMVIYNIENLNKIIAIVKKLDKKAFIHLKLETGNNRQGILKKDIDKFLNKTIAEKRVIIEGLSTHFADIEDTTDHRFAMQQLTEFKDFIEYIESRIGKIKYKHCANSAASLLFKETYFNFLRPGISIYGMWPSKETYISALSKGSVMKLKPVLTWKSIVAQVKTVERGSFIGYGRTYKASYRMKIAIIPIGYYDGYVRLLSNKGYVLIKGERAGIVGRVCMNIIMADITHIKNVSVEDEVILLGGKGHDRISAELMADWSYTINYEVTTRINERIPRIKVQ